MNRFGASWWRSLVLVLLCAAWLGGPLASEAAQIRGTVQQLDALDSAGATAADQMRNGSGKSAAVVVGGISTLLLIFGYVSAAALTGIGALGSVFMQNATAGAYDSAPAASGALEVLVPWVRTLEGFGGGRLLYDPVFYVALGLSLLTVWYASRRQTRLGAAA